VTVFCVGLDWLLKLLFLFLLLSQLVSLVSEITWEITWEEAAEEADACGKGRRAFSDPNEDRHLACASCVPFAPSTGVIEFGRIHLFFTSSSPLSTSRRIRKYTCSINTE
jgi:hypothetical protein